MESEADPGWGGLCYCNNHFKIILTKFIKIDMMAVQASEKRMRDMIITKETDYALRILRVLLDGEKHSVAEMSETELIPTQFAYQILRKLSAGNLVRVSRVALAGCELSFDLDATCAPAWSRDMYAAGRTSMDGAPSTVSLRPCSESRTRRSAP